jgi:hypothetical protein
MRRKMKSCLPDGPPHPRNVTSNCSVIDMRRLHGYLAAGTPRKPRVCGDRSHLSHGAKSMYVHTSILNTITDFPVAHVQWHPDCLRVPDVSKPGAVRGLLHCSSRSARMPAPILSLRRGHPSCRSAVVVVVLLLLAGLRGDAAMMRNVLPSRSGRSLIDQRSRCSSWLLGSLLSTHAAPR